MKKGLRILQILHGFLLISMVYDLIIQVAKPGDDRAIYQNILLLPAVALLSVACWRAKYFWQFLAVSAAVGAAVFYGSRQNIWMTLCSVFAAGSYFRARAKKEECWLEVPAYPWLTGYLLLSFEGEYFHNEFLANYLCVKAALYFLIYNFHTNLVEMDRFVTSHANLERFPVRRMGRINQIMMWIFNGTIAVAMIVAPFLGIDEMLRQAGRALTRILRWLVSFLFGGSGQTENIVPEQPVSSVMPTVGEEETSLFFEILYRILNILGWLIAAALILSALWMVIKRLYLLYRDFNVRTEENGDRVERLTAALIQEKKKGLKPEKREHLFWDQSTDARIRKHYKKRIIRELGKNPPSWYTPCQLEKELSMELKEREQFHRLYEKARYAETGCSREEMEKMLKIKG